MAAQAVKTVIATGTSSGLGFEVVKQLLLDQPHPYRFILGVRDPNKSRGDFDALKFDKNKHEVSLHKLDLADLKGTQSFANEAIKTLGSASLDYLFLNAGWSEDAKKGPPGSPHCNSYLINHLSQHYLIHLLRDTVVKHHARIVVVSSGAVCRVSDASTLESTVKLGSDAGFMEVYSATKFQQLLGAHWWRRELKDQATVIAVSPGLIKDTGLGRNTGMSVASMPDAKDVPTGARSLLAAFTRDDFPKDPQYIFLTSWGEWWDPKKQFPASLNVDLQNRWCPSREEIEREAHL